MSGVVGMRRKDSWPDEELDVLDRVYPLEGARGVRKLLPHRSMQAIHQRASRRGIVRIGKPVQPAAKAKASATPVPAHDYAPEDHAWMATRLPVFVGGFGAAVIGRASA